MVDANLWHMVDKPGWPACRWSMTLGLRASGMTGLSFNRTTGPVVVRRCLWRKKGSKLESQFLLSWGNPDWIAECLTCTWGKPDRQTRAWARWRPGGLGQIRRQPRVQGDYWTPLSWTWRFPARRPRCLPPCLQQTLTISLIGSQQWDQHFFKGEILVINGTTTIFSGKFLS